MTVIYTSDFDLAGSGYMNIGIELCTQLAERGYDVIALGSGYQRQEHNYPFKLVSVQSLQEIPSMVNGLKSSLEIEAIITALDVPLQENLMKWLNVPGDIPYIGLFPLEAPPLTASWAMAMFNMDDRLIMSEFGRQALAAENVESTVIPIGVNMDAWKVPTPKDRKTIRENMGVDDETTVVLTVADNQERKNLSRSMEIFADYAAQRPAAYWMVTRPTSPYGWRLEDYAMELGIMDKYFSWERGLPFRNLWALYAAADVMLLTSKAEGLAMPVLEAMACRLPVIGTGCTAIKEHLEEGRGLLIESDYEVRDVFGNGTRYHASREDGLYQMRLWRDGMAPADISRMLDKAQAYVRARRWTTAGDVLAASIERVKRPEKVEK